MALRRCGYGWHATVYACTMLGRRGATTVDIGRAVIMSVVIPKSLLCLAAVLCYTTTGGINSALRTDFSHEGNDGHVAFV